MTREVKNGKVALKGGQCGRMEKNEKNDRYRFTLTF